MLTNRVLWCAALLIAVCSNSIAADLKPDAVEFFERDVRPLLVARCYECHSTEKEQRGNLVLDSKAGWETGGESGPTVVPGKPDESLLVEAIRYDSFEMPPEKPLSDKQIAILVKWVKMGAPDPRTEGGPNATRGIDIEKGREYWAFQPPKRAQPPKVHQTDWPRGDIDRFILAAQEAAGIAPVKDADRQSLIRRVSYDLTGLPPLSQEADGFVNDPAPAPRALEKVVDRLLALPQFGERWGRHWLDVARYGDSAINTPLKYAYLYRDYVIRSFNEDKPFDRFIKEQLAGDLLAASDDEDRDELIIATGFLALGNRNESQTDEVVDEQIDCTGRAFLGLTVACARCHDHKFDPIPTADYYAMAGIFRSTKVQRSSRNQKITPRPLTGADLGKQKRFEQKLDQFRKSLVRKRQAAERERDRYAGELRSLQRRYKDQPSNKPPSDVVRTKQRLEQAEKKLAQVNKESESAEQELQKLRQPVTCGAAEAEKIVDQKLYIRGERSNQGDVVPRGFVQVVTYGGSHLVQNKEQSGRLELAEWIASRNNPLTARVLVNRVWHHLFGEGIVPTVDNFGAMGLPPSNPELLDYLAVEFMEDGWSVKRLVRRIVLSRVYQLSSLAHAENEQIDGDNRLVWRHHRRRLDAEAIRDAILAFSGRLDLEPPSSGQFVDLAYNSADYTIPNRSVYVPVMRQNAYDFFAAFDGADPSTVMGRRNVSVVPTQALYLLNSPLVMEESRRAAERVLGRNDLDDSARVQWAYQLALSRRPTDAERQWTIEFLEVYPEAVKEDGTSVGDAELETWTRICQSLIASAEFQILN